MRQFSDQHLAALGLAVLGAAVCIMAGRWYRGRPLVWLSRGLAFLIFAGWAGEYVAEVVQGTWTVRYSLPLQLTDAVSASSMLALVTWQPLAIELAFFWSFTASLQAVLTPDLAQTFPRVYYFTYFAYHIGAVVGSTFLVFGCQLYPRPRAVWRVYGTTLAFAAIAGAGDLLTGGNYMYLRQKPAHASLLSVLGSWPWYIVGAAAVGLAMLLTVAGLTRVVRTIVDGENRVPSASCDESLGGAST